MKKALSLLLALVLCLALFGCGSETQTPETTEPGTIGETEPEGEALVIHDEEEGYTFINQDRFPEILEAVELTCENWAEYLTVCTYTEEKVYRDTFGDISSTETNTYHVLGAAGQRYYYLKDCAIELMDKTTGETAIYNSSQEIPADFDLSAYECTRIKGTLYFIDVPEEALFQTEDGLRYFIVRYSDISYGPPCLGEIAGMDGYGVSGTIDLVFLYM